MRNGLTIVLLVLSGLAVLATGVTGLIAPQTLLAPLGLEIDGVNAANEIRAAYGGMHAAIGVLLLIGAWRPAFRRPALWLTFAFMGGLTFGRGVSAVIDGMPGGFVFQLWIPEGLAAVLAAGLLREPEAGEPV